MKIAISQPTYLPWLGYFDLIDQVDTFVFLDNVQFERQSWQQRNRIKTPTGLQWLTVPVVFRGRFGQSINEVEIRDVDFGRTHLRAIELNYRRCAFFDRYWENLKARITSPANGRLVDLNIGIIEWCVQKLGIRTKVLRSSGLGQKGKQANLLANICGSLGATEYLSPLGSVVYLLEQIDVFTNRDIQVLFQHYDHPVYRQLFSPFCSHASILDLLMNEGDESLSILRGGRRNPLFPREANTFMPTESRVS